jgi:hypothetical protein
MKEPPSIGLLPEAQRVAYDPSKDPVLEAIRLEIAEIVAQPFQPKSLLLAQSLLQHAQSLLQLRRGAPAGAKRGRRGMLISADYNSYAGEMGEDSSPLADAPESETMGTHAFRELTGLMTKALDAQKELMAASRAPQPAPVMLPNQKAMATESTVRALVQATQLPDGMREEIVGQLRGELMGILGPATTTVDMVAEPPANAATEAA